MATLAKWEKARPDNFYSLVTHLWLQNSEGMIEVCERGPGQIHADKWGDEAWNISMRGYYAESLGIVAAHAGLYGQRKVLSMLAEEFPNAIYYCD